MKPTKDLLQVFLSLVVVGYVSAVISRPERPTPKPALAPTVSLQGLTPCCLDRLTTLSCVRLKNANPAQFHHKCTTNADFAIVQCCRTCFEKTDPRSETKYEKMASKLLVNPITNLCFDRRSENFCKAMFYRHGIWNNGKLQHLGCSQLPFAFRICRKTCGYCSANAQQLAAVSYSYKVATDQGRCDSPKKFFATEPVVSQAKIDFDPLANIPMRSQSPDDYFVVTDHEYVDFENEQ